MTRWLTPPISLKTPTGRYEARGVDGYILFARKVGFFGGYGAWVGWNAKTIADRSEAWALFRTGMDDLAHDSPEVSAMCMAMAQQGEEPQQVSRESLADCVRLFTFKTD
jgi:hypothetical protein